ANEYTRKLWEATIDLYNPQLGYYEGFYEKTGKAVTALGGSTNSLILQSLLYMTTNQQPLIHPETAMDSPWWQAVAAGEPGHGLPPTATQKARLILDPSGAYWTAESNNTTPVSLERKKSGVR
ncbi:DUF3131 domain-containing protein, partial [Allocoleopsis sp.]|uniref:DUF3131 domain-containing protein n=1 Tax=Allocoleopsis sp. TaxID=3088169 RepID=UPI002FD03E4A